MSPKDDCMKKCKYDNNNAVRIYLLGSLSRLDYQVSPSAVFGQLPGSLWFQSTLGVGPFLYIIFSTVIAVLGYM